MPNQFNLRVESTTANYGDAALSLHTRSMHTHDRPSIIVPAASTMFYPIGHIYTEDISPCPVPPPHCTIWQPSVQRRHPHLHGIAPCQYRLAAIHEPFARPPPATLHIARPLSLPTRCKMDLGSLIVFCDISASIAFGLSPRETTTALCPLVSGGHYTMPRGRLRRPRSVAVRNLREIALGRVESDASGTPLTSVMCNRHHQPRDARHRF